MYAAAIIVFREVLEAALVVSIVLAASRGIKRRGAAIVVGATKAAQMLDIQNTLSLAAREGV